MDILTPRERSERMARIRGKNTKPELAVRRLAHALGYRFRLHRRDLPGSPDIVFPSRRKVVFIHGCFWHGCPKCVDGKRQVKSNKKFWKGKVEGNRSRDIRNRSLLESQGWKVLTIWECDVKNDIALEQLAADIEKTATPPR